MFFLFFVKVSTSYAFLLYGGTTGLFNYLDYVLKGFQYLQIYLLR